MCCEGGGGGGGWVGQKGVLSEEGRGHFILVFALFNFSFFFISKVTKHREA